MKDERTKEQVYDDEVCPLMEQIIEICKRRKIAMIANFRLESKEDDDLCCTTALLTDDYNPTPHQLQAFQVLRPKPIRHSVTRITKQGPNGAETLSEVHFIG